MSIISNLFLSSMWIYKMEKNAQKIYPLSRFRNKAQIIDTFANYRHPRDKEGSNNMSTQKTIEEILSAAVVASPPIVTQPPTDLETRTDDLQLRTADALAEVEELLSIREPLPTDLWREFTGSEAASEAWRYYESVTERYIAFYHAGDGVGVVTGQKVDYSIQDDFGLMMGDRSAALSAALASIKAEL